MAKPAVALTPEFCVIFGANEGAALPLGGGALTLGREVENDIVLDGAGIAARHATIELAEGHIVLDTGHPVWTESEPVRGRVEIAFDRPFRVGSCLCVVTTDPDAWFQQDVSEVVTQLFRNAAPAAPEASAPGASTPEESTPEASDPEISGEVISDAPARAGSVFTAGPEDAIFGAPRHAALPVEPLTIWQQAVAAVGGWRVYDPRRLRRAVVAVSLLGVIAFSALYWAGGDGANAWGLGGRESLTEKPVTAAAGDVGAAAGYEDRQQEELRQLVRLVSSDGRVEIDRSPNGELAVRGFVMSGNAYVRLLSGLSMLRFPVDMQVQNRGSQVKALELLVGHTKDANLEIAVDNQTGYITVSGSLPTQAQVDQFVQQVKLELPSIANLSLTVESTDTVAKQIATDLRQAELQHIQVMRSATEVVLAGSVDPLGMKKLEVILAKVATVVPVQNRVELFEDQNDLQVTAADLGLMAIVMGTRPVIVARSGKRFEVGDVIEGRFTVVDIKMDEVIVRRGTYMTPVAFK